MNPVKLHKSQVFSGYQVIHSHSILLFHGMSWHPSTWSRLPLQEAPAFPLQGRPTDAVGLRLLPWAAPGNFSSKIGEEMMEVWR
jgi:hypothetical protein